jgi:hypothetical protein
VALPEERFDACCLAPAYALRDKPLDRVIYFVRVFCAGCIVNGISGNLSRCNAQEKLLNSQNQARAILADESVGAARRCFMARFVVHGLALKRILIVVSCLVACAWIEAPVALAQHVGHVGGAAAHIYAPRPLPVRPFASAPRVGAFRYGAGIYHRGPYGPFRFRPVFPVYGSPFLFGPYSWIWGSWGYGGCWWTSYYPCGGWGIGYNAPFYEYGPVLAPVYQYYGEEGPAFPQLFLKDGTVYTVADYWLVDKQLHFMVMEPGRRGPVEHVIDVDDLDVNATIDANTDRGFRFVMRNEPLHQYMRDYPNQIPPDWPRAKE